jgi:hypothetical protein
MKVPIRTACAALAFAFASGAALAQKTQPIAQPTCVLMQMLRRSPSRRRTHSIRAMALGAQRRAEELDLP